VSSAFKATACTATRSAAGAAPGAGLVRAVTGVLAAAIAAGAALRLNHLAGEPDVTAPGESESGISPQKARKQLRTLRSTVGRAYELRNGQTLLTGCPRDRAHSASKARLAYEQVMKRHRLGPAYSSDLTLVELFKRYLAGHGGQQSTKTMLRWKLDKAEAAFPDRTQVN